MSITLITRYDNSNEILTSSGIRTTLTSLMHEAAKYPHRAKKHKEIVKIFFECLTQLPTDEIFPIGEPKKEIQQIFLTFATCIKHQFPWSDPGSDALHDFCLKLSPTQEERFLKNVPLSFLPAPRVAGIREMSRRFSLKQIDDHAFADHFDFYCKKGGQYFIGNGATAFLQGVSPELLEHLLRRYSEDFHIDKASFLLGFKMLGPTPEAFQKLKIFIEWYSRDVMTWQTAFRQAMRLLIILSMALPLLHHTNGHVINLINSREIGRAPPSAHLHTWLGIKLSRLHEWVPDHYKSWSNLLAAAQIRSNLSDVDWPGFDEIKTYFHA